MNKPDIAYASVSPALQQPEPETAVLEQLRELLSAEFEIDPNLVALEANLFDDLDIDSIDAIDMLARLRQLTGKDLPAEELKSVRSIGDVVALVNAS